MMRSVLVVCCLLVCQAPAAAGDSLRAEVQRLIEQLDAPRLTEREAAEAELLRRGPAVLPFLSSGDGQAPAEVKQRVGRIRQRLERAVTDQAADASKITLHAQSMPLSKVLKQFQQQSGNTIVDYRRQFGQPVSDPKLTVDFDKMDFWPSWDRLLDQAGLAVYPYAKQRAIGVVSSRHAPRAVAGNGTRSVPATLASYSGPFRFEPLSIVALRNLRQADGDSLVVSVETFWEPRLRIISLTYHMSDVLAVDEHGKPLPAATTTATLEVADVRAADSPAVNIDIRLQRPPRDVRQIATLQGKLLATIAGRDVTFRFSKLDEARDVAQCIAGVTVTLEQARKSADGYEVRMRARFDDAGDALASHRQWIFNNVATLEAADGKSIAYAGVEPTAQAKNEIGLAYRFTTDRPLRDMAFTYTTPGAIINREFPYELKNIDLP